ncbi:MAG: S-layer homology domain-containing protein, partial [Bacillota bacterium]
FKEVIGRKISCRMMFSWVLAIVVMLSAGITQPAAADDGGDTTPPEWADGYPFASRVSDKEFLLCLRGKEPGTAYWVVLADGEEAPSAEQVENRQNADGETVPGGSCNFIVIGETAVRVTGLMPDTSYDVYVVAKDAAGNRQAAPSLVEATTTFPDYDRSGVTDIVQGAPGSRQVTLTVTMCNAAGTGSPGYPAGDFCVTVESLEDGEINRVQTNFASAPFSGFTDNDNGTYTVVFTGTGDGTYYTLLSLTVSGFLIDSSCSFETPPGYVCEIVGGAQYTDLGDALDVVQDGQTIRLLADIYYNSGIEIEGMDITFDLAGHTLEVVDPSSGGAGLWVMDGAVTYVDSTGLGEFNVTGEDAGVQAMDDGTAMVTNATATGEEGCGAWADGGSIAVYGDAIATGGHSCGVLAEAGGSVHVYGDAAGIWCGAYATGDSTVRVDGNAQGEVYGAYADGGSYLAVIEIGGNAAATADGGVGACAVGSRSVVTVAGDVAAEATDGVGAFAADGGSITIDGIITADCYIKAGSGSFAMGDWVEPTTKEGYHTYTDGTNTVWVKIEPADTTPPTVPTGLVVTGRTKSSISIKWNASTDASGIAGYDIQMKQGNEGAYSIAGTTGGNTTGFTKTGLNASTGYYFRVRARDGSPNANVSNWSDEISAATMGDAPGSGTNGGSESGAKPAPPSYKADVSGIGASMTMLPVNVNTSTGNAATNMGALAEEAFGGTGKAVVMVPSIPDVDSYTLEMPAAFLAGSQDEGALTFSTPLGNVVIPGGMLAGTPGTEGKKAGITIARGDKTGLPDEVQTAIGNRPVVQLTLTLDGAQTDWNNPDAPVTVSIPYTPATEELANPESIVIWYIDGSGNAVCVPNGRYDPDTGTVTFTTTHFSRYAVSFKQVSFKDVSKNAWYARAVSFIAARDITTGTGGGSFSPDARLTRGEFIVMLMRACGIEADASPDPAKNFSDADNTYYTGYLAAAKRLGITKGVGNNMYAPGREITRQEMFTLLYNVLKKLDRLPQGNSGKTLSDFSDAGLIAPWAKEAMTLLVRTGAISGSNGRLDPAGGSTRAQMAQVLYNLLGK